jgi:hypothetical protein
VIKAVANWAKSKKKPVIWSAEVHFKECPESDVKKGTNQMCAPLFFCFFLCDLIVTENKDVLQGIANGTACKFWKLVLKQGAELEKIKMYDHWVHAVGTENIEYIEVEWQDCEHSVGKFGLKPKVGTFRVRCPISEFGVKARVQTNIELQHLPVIVNHATTGHKLQGKTVKSLAIAEWSKVKNWAYVVLSCVKTLSGLFLMSPIPEDIDFGPAEHYLDMMQTLRQRILATPDQVTELKNNSS